MSYYLRPLPQVLWKKNGRAIGTSPNVIQDNYGKTLVIKYPTSEDEGTYTCEVSNGAGDEQSYSITLNIEGKNTVNEVSRPI